MHGIVLRAEATGIRPSCRPCAFTSIGRGGHGYGPPLWTRSIATPSSQIVKPRDVHCKHLSWQRIPVPHSPSIMSATTATYSPQLDEATTTSTSFKDQVDSLLRIQNPEQLLESLHSHPYRDELVASLPRPTFTEILRLLNPAYFLDPFKKADRFISPVPHLRAQSPHKSSMPFETDKLESTFKNFMATIDGLMYARTSLRRERLHIVEYTFLLNCARLMGNAKMAARVWSGMKSDGVVPNTTCYNYFMEAKCWSQAYLWFERERLRVIPYNLNQRLPPWKARTRWFKGHRIGPMGLKSEVMNDFREMVQNGEPGDEATFTILMTAMAREGDIDGVKNVLLDAWNINVEAIMNLDGNMSEGPDLNLIPKQYPPNSRLIPSTRLLFVIAHVFCINNDMATAMRLLDFVSRSYSIPLTSEIWEYLMEWTYVLSVPRYKLRKTDGANTGQLAPASVYNLWDTIIREPYNAVPTMPMYHFLIKSFAKRYMLIPMVNMMRQALRLHDLSRGRHIQAKKDYEAEFQKMDGHVSPSTIRKAKLAALENSRDTRFIKHWVVLLLGSANDRYPDRQDSEWELREFPNAIQEWSKWIPPEVFNTNKRFEVFIRGSQVSAAFNRFNDNLRFESTRGKYMEPESTIYTIGESLRISDDLDDDSVL